MNAAIERKLMPTAQEWDDTRNLGPSAADWKALGCCPACHEPLDEHDAATTCARLQQALKSIAEIQKWAEKTNNVGISSLCRMATH
jgi:hypothetical protein